jgi:hypothetical protein
MHGHIPDGFSRRACRRECAATSVLARCRRADRITGAGGARTTSWGTLNLLTPERTRSAAGPARRALWDGPARRPPHSPTASPRQVPWLAERDIALLACDNRTVEAIPNPEGEDRLPLHVAALNGLGLPLGEPLVLDELADHCAAMGRHEGLLVVGTLPVLGAVGPPATPLFFTWWARLTTAWQ